MNIIHFENIDSTNTYLKKNHQRFDDFQVISATHQTEGKGRLGNVWIDDGQSALFSILIKRNIKADQMSQIPLVAVVALHKVLSNILNHLLIKWPNDLLVNNKKIAGILSESIMDNNQVVALIVGMGINVGNLNFPLSLKSTSTSILLETNQMLSVPLLIQEIVSTFDQELHLLENRQSDYLSYFKRFSSILGKDISYIQNGLKCYATAIDISENGNLIVKSSDGIAELNSGEIHLKNSL